MRAIERVLVEMARSERPLLQVLDSQGAQALCLSYRQVIGSAQALAARLSSALPAARLRAAELPRIGVACANSPGFVVADLACLIARVTEVPVPLAFSASQAAGLLDGVDVCLVDGNPSANGVNPALA